MSAETFIWVCLLAGLLLILSGLAFIADLWTAYQARRQWFRPMATPKPMTKDEVYQETTKRG